MKLVRFAAGSTEYKGIFDGEKIKRVNGSFFHEYSLTTDCYLLEDVKILPPIIPQKIIGVRRGGVESELTPIFLKPSSSVIAASDEIIFPNDVEKIYGECELALVIGKKCRNIKPHEAKNFILGVTVANDVTASSKKFSESFTVGKYYDTFTPLGAFIDTSVDFSDLKMSISAGGKLLGEGSTKEIAGSVNELVAYLSSVMTLSAGDIILTGAVFKSVELNRGEVCECEIECIGKLSNKVI